MFLSSHTFSPLRHAGVFEVTICSFIPKSRHPQEKTVFLSHDLSMLRLIETFSESAPQLVLMLTLILQRGLLDTVTGTGCAHVIARMKKIR